MISLSPLSNRVVLRVDPAETVAPSGIILSTKSVDIPDRGEVLAAGPGKILPTGERVDMTVAVGDKVIYARGTGMEIVEDGEVLLVLTEDEIIGVFR